MIVTHKFVSSKPDSLDLTLVNPSNWNATHVVQSGTIIAGEYNFTPQAPGQNLIVGSNQITMAPVPVGLAIGSYLCIHDAGGTVEPVPVTGIGSNYIIVTCTKPHSGSWTIQSATGGIQEAINANTSGTIVVDPGTINLCSNITLKSNMTLQGAGIGATVLKVTTGAWPTTNSGSFYSPGATLLMVVTTFNDCFNINMRDFTVDVNNVPFQPFGCMVGVVNSGYCTIERVCVINNSVNGISIGGLRSSIKPTYVGLRILNCQVKGIGGPIGTTAGGIFTQIYNSLIGWNYLENLADEYLIANNVVDCTFIGNFCVGAPGNQTPVCHQEDSSRTQWIGNTIKGQVGIGFHGNAVNTTISTDFVMIGNSIVPDDAGRGCANGIHIAPTNAGDIQSEILIIGNTIIGCWQAFPSLSGYGVNITSSGSADRKCIVQGNLIRQWFNGVSCPNGCKNVVIKDNIIEQNRDYGVSASGASFNIVIRDNILVNNGINNISTNGNLGCVIGPNVTDLQTTNMVADFGFPLTLVNGANQNVDITQGLGIISNNLYCAIAGPTAAFSVGGINGGVAGKRVVLSNSSAGAMTINHADPGSSAVNRIFTSDGLNRVTNVAELLCADGTHWLLI